MNHRNVPLWDGMLIVREAVYMWGQRVYWVLSTQFGCHPKTVIKKNKVYLRIVKKSWKKQIINKIKRKPAFRAKYGPFLWICIFIKSFGPTSPCRFAPLSLPKHHHKPVWKRYLMWPVILGQSNRPTQRAPRLSIPQPLRIIPPKFVAGTILGKI